MEIILDTTLRLNSSTLDWDALLRSLEQLTKMCLNSESRSQLSPPFIKDLSIIMETLVKEDLRYDDILAEAFRFLRNSVIACKRNQDIIREETSLFETTASILQRILEIQADQGQVPGQDSDKMVIVVRCALQFVANSIVNNHKNSERACCRFSGLLGSLTNSFDKDEKVIQYAAMIGHLGLKQTPQTLQLNLPFLRSLLDNLHLEFVIYTMESLILYGNFLELYEDLEPGERIKLVSFLNERPDLFENLDEKIISKLKTNFIERSDFILRSKIEDRDNLFCWEIAILLELICSASSTDVEALKSDSVLLTTTLCLLRQIDAIGKETGGTENVFSPVKDLTKLTSKSTTPNEIGEDDIRAHPTFQFKAHLIRLIANLAHKNTSNQDKVRELECLPIILDNCKIDARNPFISQWSILAIRNLCEGNDANQAYIREVQRMDTENILPKLQLVNLNEAE